MTAPQADEPDGAKQPAGAHDERRPAGLRIRHATDADVPVLLEIVQSAYRGEGGWTTEAHLVRGHRTDDAEVRALLVDPHVLLLVAELPEEPATASAPGDPAPSTPIPAGLAQTSAGPILGCCYTRRDPRDPSRAELGLFAVSPAAQGAGVGRALLEEHVDRRQAEGVRRIDILVLQNRPELRSWYERRGFRRLDGTLPFPADPSLLIEPGMRMEPMVRTLP